MSERRRSRHPLRYRRRDEVPRPTEPSPEVAPEPAAPEPVPPPKVRPGLTLEPTTITFAALVGGLDARETSQNQFAALCPAHEDRRPSLSFTTSGSRILLYCFAGCSYSDIVAALERRNLWPVVVDQDEHPPRPDQTGLPPSLIEFDAQLQLPEKSVVERYLAHRGIDVRALNGIGYHPKAYHAPTGTSWPCMVAAVRDVEGRLRSLHRTFLSYTDPPTKAPVDPPRMLWAETSSRGSAVRLAPAARELLIGEGIETTASAMIALGLPGWSAISLAGLKTIELPDLVEDVVIAADNDPPGIRAARAAAQRLRLTGRTVRVEKPAHVNDFNDLLRMRRAYER